MPGETILSGAKRACAECGAVFEPQVLLSAAGYYIGTECSCGPNSRESVYFASREEADGLLPEYDIAFRGGQKPASARE